MKKIYQKLYVHKSNIEELKQALSPEQAKRLSEVVLYANAEPRIHFEVIKYNLSNDDIILINAVGWDKLYEPIVGNSHIFMKNGGQRIIHGGKTVYHQKHLFVSPDYTGFDIEESKQRTALLERLPLVKNHKSRIGSLKYWTEVLDYYKLPTFMKRSKTKMFIETIKVFLYKEDPKDTKRIKKDLPWEWEMRIKVPKEMDTCEYIDMFLKNIINPETYKRLDWEFVGSREEIELDKEDNND